MKFYVRQQHSSSRYHLLNSIDEGICRITDMDCWGWVQHTKQFYDTCLDRHHIDNTVPTSDTSNDDSTDDQHEENEHEE